MPKPIKKQRVDIMAVLKNHELRIMVVERSLLHLVQAISTAVKGETMTIEAEAVVQPEPEMEAPGQPVGED